ncbi:RNA polymerase sigma-70 factor, ECF subfamily [Halpernia humi]|uniref:RNA polymerase sigma-70 factor, ECF subfamily n=1 Tax=Halpernia humi TaxID=493375 RepID=A0A1H6BGY9_9FLAO|nr:sigma-70 family RNA polymerase sigma factor [Halpernia humi]SEG60028.1 RNA polymerase sigma-70 factor, ECF subfamily [Halpernia humi]
MQRDLEKEFVSLLKEHQRLVHKICRIYTNDSQSHEDLFQEIAIQVWKSFANFRGEAKFSTWMYRIALNTALSLMKKKQRTILTSSEIDVNILKINSETYKDEEEEKLKKMYAAIHQLSDIEKALVMMYLDDKSHREIAEILGITEGNARVKLNRAKNHLKSLIKN